MKVAICHTKADMKGHAICDAFAKGVEKCGDSVRHIFYPAQLTQKVDTYFQVCDYNKHVQTVMDFRYEILRKVHAEDKHRIIVDTGFFSKTNSRLKNDLDGYYAISIDGIKGLGRYNEDYEDGARFKQLNLEPRRWQKTTNKKILILGQHEIGISTQHTDIIKWWENIIRDLKRIYPLHDIIFRPHPNQTKFPRGNYTLSENKSLEEDLEGCFLAVGKTTNASIDALLNGVCLFTDDKVNMAHKYASYSLQSRKWAALDSFFNYLANNQWNLKEMEEGTPWLIMKDLL